MLTVLSIWLVDFFKRLDGHVQASVVLLVGIDAAVAGRAHAVVKDFKDE